MAKGPAAHKGGGSPPHEGTKEEPALQEDPHPLGTANRIGALRLAGLNVEWQTPFLTIEPGIISGQTPLHTRKATPTSRSRYLAQFTTLPRVNRDG